MPDRWWIRRGSCVTYNHIFPFPFCFPFPSEGQCHLFVILFVFTFFCVSYLEQKRSVFTFINIHLFLYHFLSLSCQECTVSLFDLLLSPYACWLEFERQMYLLPSFSCLPFFCPSPASVLSPYLVYFLLLCLLVGIIEETFIFLIFTSLPSFSCFFHYFAPPQLVCDLPIWYTSFPYACWSEY